jgi:hypothetical protein
VPLELHVGVLLQQVQRVEQQQPPPWQQQRVLGLGPAALGVQVLLRGVDAAELPAGEGGSQQRSQHAHLPGISRSLSKLNRVARSWPWLVTLGRTSTPARGQQMLQNCLHADADL